MTKKLLLQILAISLILYAIYLAVMIFFDSFNNAGDTTGKSLLYVLLLDIPLPLHLLSVGIYLQRNYISWIREIYTRILVIVSGIWLGIAFFVKYFF